MLWRLSRPSAAIAVLNFPDLTIIISIGNLLDFLVGTVQFPLIEVA